MLNIVDALRMARERREYERVSVALPGILSVPSEPTVKKCTVIDLSAGGARLKYDDAPPAPDRIAALSIEGFGIFEGITVWDCDAEYGMRFLFGESERQHLIQSLSVFAAEGLAAVTALRKSERWPQMSQLCFVRPNGQQYLCEVSNISFYGVALKTTERPPLQELVRIGETYGRVVRHSEDGVAIEFLMFAEKPSGVSADISERSAGAQ